MKALNLKRRQKIKSRIRGRVSGDSDRPRMSVFRSNRGIYVQVIDDLKQVTLASASYKDREITQNGTKTELAAAVGTLIAKRSIAAGIKKIAFDRNGFLYHGRIKALADAARAGGLEF